MPAPTVRDNPVAKQLRDIRDELNQQLYERSEEIEAVLVAMLAKHHVMFIGPPGVAKTMTLSLISKRVTGARFKPILLDKQTPLEALMGPYDVTAFAQGHMRRKMEGFLPTAHFIMLDEIGKANGAVLNPLLTLINERQVDDDGQRKDTPLIFAGAATNEFLPDELAAFNDRFLVKIVVNGINEEGAFQRYLLDTLEAPDNPTTVSLDDLTDAIENLVPQVEVPKSAVKRMIKMRRKLSAEAHCEPSDRTWRWSLDYLRAYAFFHGRDVVSDEDLGILRHVLWEVPEHREQVHNIVLSSTSELAQATVKFQRQLTEIEGQINDLEGKARDERGQKGADLQHKLSVIGSELQKLREDCRRKGTPTQRLDDVRQHLLRVRTRSYEVLMSADPDRARRMAQASMEGDD